MAEWKEYRLGNICSVQNGFSFKSSEFIGCEEGALEVVKMGHIQPGGGLRKEPKRDYVRRDEKLKRWVLSRGDIIMAMTDMKDNVVILGIPALIDKDDHYVLNQRVARISLLDRERIDLQFLYNYLKWKEFVQVLQSKANSGVQVNLTTDSIKDSIIIAPSLPEQRSIASVLSSLDEKIDLLRRQNKTLEASAETLFRQWFVEEAEEEWETGKLGDVISIKGGTTPSTSNPEFWNGDINWTAPRDLSRHISIFLTKTERQITKKGLEQIGSGLLQVGTVLLSSRAPIGYLAITEIPVAINQGYIAIVCDKVLSNYFVYLWVKRNLETIINAANGSVFLEISKSTFKELDFQLPPQNKLRVFDEQIKPMFDKIKSNVYQIRTLTQLRDTLLPKLMSGEVRVKELIKNNRNMNRES